MLEAHFINVGYGDAALVLQKEAGAIRFCMLIDCGGEETGKEGPPDSRVTAAEYLGELGVSKIDILLLSHLHLDHCGGLYALAEHFAVGELWSNYVPRGTLGVHEEIRTDGGPGPGPKNLLRALDVYTRALRLLKTKKTVIREITAGFSYDCPLGHISVLAGGPPLLKRQAELLGRVLSGQGTNALLTELDGFINNTSLRAELRLNDRVFLFAGDIYASEWEKEGIFHADVLKVPHHGHADAMNAAVAEKLRPDYAVISVSNTRTDCPSPSAVEALQRAGAQVLFTDAAATPGCPQGDPRRAVVFRVDGRGRIAVFY